MSRRRREMTLTDYAVIAINPILIMLLVGSLAFFLLEVMYGGAHKGRMSWLLFWFVLAAVLTGRIAIEQGRMYASMFTGAMALAAMIYTMRFAEASAVVVTLILLAVIWWCSDRLTWDCTFIDDGQDSSGEGLLQASKIEKSSADEESQSPSLPKEAEKREENLLSPQKKGVTHAPGTWIVYFSLAALPLFGIGQFWIPAEDVQKRNHCFQLLMVYVASGLGLLLTTSFLGLRRYLRQRNLEMPASVSRAWLGWGAVSLLVLMGLALLPPRPQGEYTFSGIVDKVDQEVKKASRYAMLGGDRGRGDGRRIGTRDDNLKNGAGQRNSPSESSPDHYAGNSNKPDRPVSQEHGGSGPADSSSPSQTTQGQGSQGQGSQGQGSQGQGSQGQGSQGQGSQGQGSQGQGSQGQGSQGQGSQGQGSQGQGSQGQGSQGQGSQGQGSQGQGSQGQQQQTQQQQTQQQQTQQQQTQQQQTQQQQTRAQGSQSTSRTDATPPPPAGNSPAWWTSLLTPLAPIFKPLMYVLLAVIVLFFLWMNGRAIMSQLGGFWAGLVNFWNQLWGLFSDSKASTGEEEEQAPPPVRPYASFQNPFLTGADQRMSPNQLVVYTFQALEAWGRENIAAREVDQTELEFAESLGMKLPQSQKLITQTAHLYATVAYAKRVLALQQVAPLRHVWETVLQSEPVHSSRKIRDSSV